MLWKDFKPFTVGGGKAPKGWKSPVRTPRYQVQVEVTRTGRTIPVGPAIEKGVAEQFAAEIRKQIKNGHETRWSNPHLVLVQL